MLVKVRRIQPSSRSTLTPVPILNAVAITAASGHTRGRNVAIAPRITDSPDPLNDGRHRSRLDTGDLPVAELARLAGREARRPNPIYGAHRWFARRLGTAMRALLVASVTDARTDFWTAFDGDADLTGLSVADPFMGGGTSLVEALRLGARVRGVDIDAVACAVSSLQLQAASMPDLEPTLDELSQEVGAAIRPLHTIRGPCGEDREVVHWFWVQLVRCGSCGTETEAHPHFRLAMDAGAERQWTFCRSCHAIHELSIDAETFACQACASQTAISDGPVQHGRFSCPSCGDTERLIDVAGRTGGPPAWRLFASESIPRNATRRNATLAHRLFLPVKATELALYSRAVDELAKRQDDAGGLLSIPSDPLPEGTRADDRLRRYGYRRTSDLFNARQLLHLSLLAEALTSRPSEQRRAFGVAFSDHLATNCMLTGYAFGWRRLSPLFAIRGYRHIVRPVEVNPWLDGIGRGTYPNAVRQVQRAINEARRPRTLARNGAFTTLPARDAPKPDVRCADARNLDHIDAGTVDLILTDPPYLDNVAYSELADFYRPWLRMLDLLPTSNGQEKTLAVHGRDERSQEQFESGLREVMSEFERVLVPEGRITFTFRHESEGAYRSLAAAIGAAGLRAITVFPLKGDGNFGLHAHEGSTSWDAVFVLTRGGRSRRSDAERDLTEARSHVTAWASRIRSEGLVFGAADEAALARAAVAAASLGAFDRASEDVSEVIATA
jgi:putative DNA methylase